MRLRTGESIVQCGRQGALERLSGRCRLSRAALLDAFEATSHRWYLDQAREVDGQLLDDFGMRPATVVHVFIPAMITKLLSIA